MDPEVDPEQKKRTRRSSFFKQCPVTNQSPECSSSNSNTDDVDKMIADTISRILKIDETEYTSRIDELQKETRDWRAEYKKLKSECSSETSTSHDVTTVTAEDCVDYLTEEDKLFLLEKPDFGKFFNNINNLEKDLGILAYKKYSEIKKRRYEMKLVSLKIDDLNHQVGKYFDNLADTNYNNIVTLCSNGKGSCKTTDIVASCSNVEDSPNEENLLEDNGL